MVDHLTILLNKIVAKSGDLWRMQTLIENFYQFGCTLHYCNFSFPFLCHFSKNTRVLIVKFLLTLLPPYWQLPDSQFSQLYGL